MDESPSCGVRLPSAIRFRIAAVVTVLLAVTVALTGHAYFSLARLQRQTHELASVYLTDVALARHIQTRAEEMLVYLPALAPIDWENGRNDARRALDRLVQELRGDTTALETRGSIAPLQRGQMASLLFKLEMVERDIGQLDALVLARVAATVSREAGWNQVETAYARHFGVATEAEAQLRALVARALAVDIAEAAPGQLQQRLDQLLDKNLSWLATAQDIRTDSRELLEIAKQILSETDLEHLVRLQADAEVVIRRLSLYRLLPPGETTTALATATTEYAITMSGENAFSALRQNELRCNEAVTRQVEQIRLLLTATVEIASSLVDGLVVQVGERVSFSARRVGDAQVVLLAAAALTTLLALFGVYRFVRQTVLDPIEKITHAMLVASRQVVDQPDALGRQYLDPVLLRGDDEVAAMARALASFQNAIAERDAALQASETRLRLQQETEERIRQIAYHDPLTGLPNRLHLKTRLEQALSWAFRDRIGVAVLFIDMDRFKIINDTLGHRFGDELLIEIARRLESAVRQSDVVARLGGDEFVVVLVGVENVGYVAYATERIRELLGQPYPIEGHELYSTPSIGIALFPSDGDTADVLMKNADIAMYHAKASGRNNYQFFTTRMNEVVRERLSLEDHLRRALGAEQFVLHFLPQFEAKSGRAFSAEALLRWIHPVEGLMPPAQFLPVAEEIGMMNDLGDWVLRQALRQLRRWRESGASVTHVAVNISVHQWRNEQFPERLAQTLAAEGLDPGSLELELTESAAMEHPQATIAMLKRLRAIGVRLALDDFGAGFSSLGYLKSLPIQRLKLDRSFVANIATDQNDAVVCSAVVALAHTLGLDVVAEGVETREQLHVLYGLGCEAFQGYLWGRPLPGDQVARFMGRRALIWANEADMGLLGGRRRESA